MAPQSSHHTFTLQHCTFPISSLYAANNTPSHLFKCLNTYALNVHLGVGWLRLLILLEELSSCLANLFESVPLVCGYIITSFNDTESSFNKHTRPHALLLNPMPQSKTKAAFHRSHYLVKPFLEVSFLILQCQFFLCLLCFCS